MLTFLKINCFRTFPATHLLFANTRFFLYTHDELVGVKPPVVTVTWSHVILGPIEEFYDLSFFHSLATLLKRKFPWNLVMKTSPYRRLLSSNLLLGQLLSVVHSPRENRPEGISLCPLKELRNY